MKVRSIGKPLKGSSTLEILIASVVLTLALSAAALVIYGNREATLLARFNREALSYAEAQLEDARALSRVDNNLVVATTSSVTNGPLVFTKVLTVSQVDLFLKQATSTVSFMLGGRVQKIELSTYMGDMNGVQGGSTCSSVVVGNWSNPQMSAPIDVGTNPSGNPITAVVAYNKKLYVTASNTHGHNDDLYIFSLANPTLPVPLGSIDANTTTPGQNGLAIASTTTAVYAFVANANPSNWSTCSVGPSCAQVQVVDVTNAVSPAVVANIKIPSASAPLVLGSGGQAIGNAVTYKNGYLYIGLTKTSSGPEFSIYDVGGGTGSPRTPIYKGSYAVGRGINNILVSNGFAYLATSDSNRELLVLDVHNPSAPNAVGLFNAPGSANFGAGYSLALVGRTLYFGRNYVSNAPEFYMLDASNPATTLPVLTSLDVGTPADPESINGLVVRDNLLYMIATQFLKIYTMQNSTTLTLIRSFDLSSSGGVGAASGCEGNYVYIGGYRTNNDKGVIYVVSPGP